MLISYCFSQWLRLVVYCSRQNDKPFWGCFLVKKGLHLPSNHRLPPAECRFVSCQKCFARHVLQDWEWSKGARQPEKKKKTGMWWEWRAQISKIVNGMLMDVIFLNYIQPPFSQDCQIPHSENVLAKQAPRNLKRKLLRPLSQWTWSSF